MPLRMILSRSTSIILLGHLFLFSTCAQSGARLQEAAHLVGGPCEGCEAVFEYGNKPLTAIDTLTGFDDAVVRMKVTGTVYQPDGTTPAEGVILYFYHTDTGGVYTAAPNAKGWARRHGQLRTWLKTGPDGSYALYTLKPGSYPDRTTAAHIHLTILEPNGKYYWAEEYLFADDPLLASAPLPSAPRCGGSGVLTLKLEGDLLVGNRDLILGKNIPGYFD